LEGKGQQTIDRDRVDEASVAELVKQLSEQTSRLARQEVDLAKSELERKGRTLGVGLGAFGAAGLVGVLALGALTAMLILALSEAVDAWLAAAIVTVVYAAIAGVLALIGKSKAERATPPVPERARRSVRRDVEVVKESAKEGRT
jgi:hypothetical protein